MTLKRKSNVWALSLTDSRTGTRRYFPVLEVNIREVEHSYRENAYIFVTRFLIRWFKLKPELAGRENGYA